MLRVSDSKGPKSHRRECPWLSQGGRIEPGRACRTCGPSSGLHFTSGTRRESSFGRSVVEVVEGTSSADCGTISRHLMEQGECLNSRSVVNRPIVRRRSVSEKSRLNRLRRNIADIVSHATLDKYAESFRCFIQNKLFPSILLSTRTSPTCRLGPSTPDTCVCRAD